MKCGSCKDYDHVRQECKCEVNGCDGLSHYLPNKRRIIGEIIFVGIIVFGVIAYALAVKEGVL